MLKSFRLSGRDIDKSRIQARTADDVVEAFRARGIQATYEENSFTVTVDLDNVVLNREQVSREGPLEDITWLYTTRATGLLVWNIVEIQPPR